MTPPPPICLPFIGSKSKRRLSWSSAGRPPGSPTQDQIIRHPSYSPTSTMTSDADNLTFVSDSEKYDEIPASAETHHDKSGRTRIVRSNTMTGTKKVMNATKWIGYGWGSGKKEKEMEKELEGDLSREPGSISHTNLPLYKPPTRSNSKSTQASRSTQNTQDTHFTQNTQNSRDTHNTQNTHRTEKTHHSKSTHRTQSTRRSSESKTPALRRPPIYPSESSSTLVGSALDRKINDGDSIREKVDTTERLEELRKLMSKSELDYYIVPNEDAHQSEYVSESDKRREFISGFRGTAGDAIITRTSAYLFVDSRYWVSAQQQLDKNWQLIKAGSANGPKDWIEWLVGRVKDAKIGIDARMISHERASLLNSKLGPLTSKLSYPSQNLVDLVWVDKPSKSRAPLFAQGIEFTGKEASYKLSKIREWIRNQPPSIPSFQKTPATPSQYHDGTLITSLSSIAYLLNLRGSDVPYNPLFQAYLFVGLERTILFVDEVKIVPAIAAYLESLRIERREYVDLWTFLRKREWGEGKVLISPQTSYAISLMLTHFRYTVEPSQAEKMMSIKNETEIDGLRRAYLRDGVAFVRFLAWLENKLSEGYDITEWEAAHRIKEFRRPSKYCMGLAYETISASGANAALPHYSPRKDTAWMIDRTLPYLHDSGGQYRDGTCDTTRTVHFGRPTPDQCEAYTRVLQGHIAIDSAVFPEGTSGHQLDVLARRALWKDGLNYMHGTGHGFGSFLSVHEGSHGFSSVTPLTLGHVITNEPGFYLEGKYGMRIESALAVRRVKTRGDFNGDVWLGFERLTCVPIQTRMVKEGMLTKEEKAWLKDHNQRCYEKLAPFLKDDKRALKWLKREAERGIGLAPAAGGLTIDWD